LERRLFYINRTLFTVVIAIICVMGLLTRDSLNEIYQYTARLLSINPELVRGNNATTISNFGHVAACFVLTWLACKVFRNSYFTSILLVCSLACLIEFAQLFLETRQANIEDILFSFSGVSLALFFRVFHRHFSPSTYLTKR